MTREELYSELIVNENYNTLPDCVKKNLERQFGVTWLSYCMYNKKN